MHPAPKVVSSHASTLYHPNELFIHRPTRLPAYHDIVPGAGTILKQPVLSLSVKMGGKRTIDHIFLLRFIVTRRDVEMQFLAQRDSARHPDLAQFVIAMPFKAIF